MKEGEKMKKLIAIGIAVVMMLGFGALSHAESKSSSVIAHLPVTGNFGFYTWETDEYLDAVVPGVQGGLELHIFVTTNHGRQWTISANCAGLVGETQVPPQTLGVLIDTPDETDLPLTAMDQVVYTAKANEHTVTELNIGAVWLKIPTTPTTLEDLYSGTVLLTLAD